ncbi:LysM domain-containing protein [Terrimicrobium sacchariphilum]|uniref:LysM domain-containing protein n=2 Tax=Terrimicrobium sacchariphilum TaxID=690879 RepID=A0A146GA25_TERSA|nr:LysM domain-containing protein [Terrimicrobium sacchariphilum]
MKMKKVVRMPLRRAPQRPRPQAAQPMRARTATVDEAYDDEEEDYGGEAEPNMKFSHAVVVVLALHLIAVGGIFAFNSIKAKQTADSKTGKAAAVSSASSTAASENEPEVAPADVPAQAASAPVKPQNLDSWIGRSHTVQAGETLSRIAAQYKVTVSAIEKANEITSYSTLVVGQVLKIPPTGAPETKQTAPASTAKHEAAPVKAPAATGTISSATRPTTTATTAAITTAETSKPAPATKAEAETDTPGAHGTASGDVYTVAKGDNPYSIAKKLHVSYSDLLSVNEIKDPTKIQIGQRLKIPAKKN